MNSEFAFLEIQVKALKNDIKFLILMVHRIASKNDLLLRKQKYFLYIVLRTQHVVMLSNLYELITGKSAALAHGRPALR